MDHVNSDIYPLILVLNNNVVIKVVIIVLGEDRRTSSQNDGTLGIFFMVRGEAILTPQDSMDMLINR